MQAQLSLTSFRVLKARVLNWGCYLRYSDSEFANQANLSLIKDAMFLYLSFILGAVAICLLAVMIGYFSGAAIYQRQSKGSKQLKGLEMESSTMRSLHFKYSRLDKATENFSESCRTGQGGFSGVFKGALPDGREIAMKRLLCNSKVWNKDIENEIDVIGQVQHQNLVRFLGCCFTSNDRFLIYEFMPNRSLDLILFGMHTYSEQHCAST